MAFGINSNNLLPCCILTVAALLILFSSSLVLANEGSDFPQSAAASPAARTRKVLLVAVKGSSNKRLAFGSGDKPGYEEMLRSVPSGPDPLHHNGGSPKKPRPSP